MLFLAMTAASAGAAWWLAMRQGRTAARAALRAAERAFDEDAGIAIHVARHEADTRGQPPSTLHLLYGLLQVDAPPGRRRTWCAHTPTFRARWVNRA